MAEDIVVVGSPPPIAAETEAEQQAKQEASLSLEELAALDAERRENARKQAEAEAMKQNLSLEGLAEHLGALNNRVEALESAALASSKASSSNASPKAASSGDSSSAVPKNA